MNMCCDCVKHFCLVNDVYNTVLKLLELRQLQAEPGSSNVYVTLDQFKAMTVLTHVEVLYEERLVQCKVGRVEGRIDNV